MVDFHLAMRINNLDHREFQLHNIENENDYKKYYQYREDTDDKARNIEKEKLREIKLGNFIKNR